MSKKTTYLLGILLTIIIGTFLYWKFCCCCACKNPTEKIVETSTTGMGNYNSFNLSGKDINYQCYDNFKFKKDGFNNLAPVSDSINTGIDLLKANFDKNSNQRLTITGYYLNEEKNTSAFPNLGLARANDVKNYLVSKGISATTIDTKGEARDAWSMVGDTVLGAVDFLVSETEANKPVTDDFSGLKDKINANPLILYFNTNQSEISLTVEEKQKIADITTYLDKVPDAKISAVGHTDNVGDKQKNNQLGQTRADFAKQYLVKNGINADKIISSSKGPDEPIADNATADGKAKNRRTVVTIQ